MDKQQNDGSGSGTGFESNPGSNGRNARPNYDVPIPRPTVDLGFRGIRRKLPEFESQAKRRRNH